jgi:hypothetical protein
MRSLVQSGSVESEAGRGRDELVARVCGPMACVDFCSHDECAAPSDPDGRSALFRAGTGPGGHGNSQPMPWMI